MICDPRDVTPSGHQVLSDGSLILLLLCSLIFNVLEHYRYQPPDSTIHPESEEDVNNARTHLPVQVEDATQSDEGNRDARATAGAEARRRGVRTEQNITCPICLSDAEFAVETNCGHKFCGESCLSQACTCFK